MRERPDDESVRLLYADWLADTGELARSEFVRAQCRLASSNLPESEKDSLQAKSKKWLDEYEASWIAELPPVVEDVRWKLGCIDRVMVDFNKLPGQLES